MCFFFLFERRGLGASVVKHFKKTFPFKFPSGMYSYRSYDLRRFFLFCYFTFCLHRGEGLFLTSMPPNKILKDFY